MGNSTTKYYVSFHWESNEKDFEILQHVMYLSRDVDFQFARFQDASKSLDCKKERTFTMHKIFFSEEEGDRYFRETVLHELDKPDPQRSATAAFLSQIPLHYSIQLKRSGKIYQTRKLVALQPKSSMNSI